MKYLDHIKRQIKLLSNKGMFIGSHSYSHEWLETFTPKDQRREINLSIEFLEEINGTIDNWAMCYPYGSYNKSLIELSSGKKPVPINGHEL